MKMKMVGRKKKKADNKLAMIVGTIASIVVLILVLVTISKLPRDIRNQNPNNNSGSNFINWSGNNNDTSITLPDNTQHYIGDKVSNIIGTISMYKDNSGKLIYTHTLISKDNSEYGLKSQDVNLSAFSGEVIVKGEVIDIKSNVTIIEVEEIEYYEDETIEEDFLTGDDELSINNNHYYPNYGFSVRFGVDTGFNIIQNGENIDIQKFISVSGTGGNNNTTGTQTLTTILTIKPYECSSNDPQQNCQEQEELYKGYKFETFVSSNGISFYKFPEISQWIMFYDGLFGAYLLPGEGIDMFNMSNYIFAYDIQNAKDSISKNISNICVKSSLKIKEVTDFEIFKEKGRLIAEIKGIDRLNNELKCRLDLDLGDVVTTNLIWIKKLGKADTNIENNSNNTEDEANTDNNESTTATVENSKPETTNIQPTTPEVVETIENNTNTETKEEETTKEDETTIVNKDIESYSSEKTIPFKSARGFTLNMPGYVAFQGNFVTPTESFGIAGVSCQYKVDITHYKYKDNIDTDPDAKAYFCKIDMDNADIKSAIKGKNLVFISNADNTNKFLIKYDDDYGKAIADTTTVE